MFQQLQRDERDKSCRYNRKEKDPYNTIKDVHWIGAEHTFPRTQTISPDVAARKVARKKVIEKAQQLERESYKAYMRRKRMLHTSSDLAIIF